VIYEAMPNLIRVLIVEAHSLFREGLNRLLQEKEGIECVGVAAQGQTAIRLAQEHHPDIVVMDANMPDMPGADIIKNIKQRCPNTHIIVLSHYRRFQYIINTISAGADAYLSKQMLDTDLIDTIRLVHRGLSVFDEVVASDVICQLATSAIEKGLHFDTLNKRELEVLTLTAKGMSNKQIGLKLGISPHTVARHLEGIFSKTGVESRTEAVFRALERGWLEIPGIWE